MQFHFTATETDNLQIQISINGRTQTIDFEDCKLASSGEYYIASFRNITAIEFADEVKAEFLVNGEKVGQTAVYTVDSYVYQWQGVTDEEYTTIINLTKALYNYGKSAKNSITQ